MTMHHDFDKLTEKLLEKAGVDGPPVPLAEIAKFLGAQIRYEASQSDLDGALYHQGDNVVIGVNSVHPKVRQRFTIAHEIGHLRLHDMQDEVFHVDRFGQFGASTAFSQQPSTKRFLRSKVSSLATDAREIEANKFAAALLMPTMFLVQSLEKVDFPLDEKAIRKLAKKYAVSTQAMNYRLINLGVPVRF